MRDLFEVIRGIPPTARGERLYAEQTRFNSNIVPSLEFGRLGSSKFAMSL